MKIETIKFELSDKQARDSVAALVMKQLQEEGINVESFAFEIQVEYVKEKDWTPVLAKPRPFLELLGYHRNEDGTFTSEEELEEEIEDYKDRRYVNCALGVVKDRENDDG